MPTYGGGGVFTFQACLNFYNNTGTDVWVAYVSNEPLIDPNQINRSGIEMYMSVTTSEHAIFTTHMGIQRVPCEKPHKNISVTLHKFCAKTMHEYYPDKTFMLNAPLQLMRDILLSAMETCGKGDAVYIYDSLPHLSDERVKDMLIELQSSIQKNQENGRNLLPTAIPELHLYENLLSQREKIKKGELFPHITKYPTFTIRDKHTGAELFSMNSDDPEFVWFFKNMDLNSSSAMAPIISINLIDLATLSDQSSNAFHHHKHDQFHDDRLNVEVAGDGKFSCENPVV